MNTSVYTPTRYGILTARYCRRQVEHLHWELPTRQRFWVRHLGCLHLNHNYYKHKLERTGEHDLYKDGKPYDHKGVWADSIFADEAISFINAESEKPFSIYLPFQAPHAPFQNLEVPLDPSGKKERKMLIKMIERLNPENDPDQLMNLALIPADELEQKSGSALVRLRARCDELIAGHDPAIQKIGKPTRSGKKW